MWGIRERYVNVVEDEMHGKVDGRTPFGNFWPDLDAAEFEDDSAYWYSGYGK